MGKKYILRVLAAVLALAMFQTVALAAPNVVVTNSGLALLIGETEVRPGSSVIIQIVPEGEEPLTANGKINGYINETVVQQDGTYKLLFPLGDMYEDGNGYDCHIDIAGREYYLVPLVEGSLIEITEKNFDRDTKTITIVGSLWDSSAYGIELTITIGDFEQVVESSEEDGEFVFEFTMEEAEITEYGMCEFVVSYTDDPESYCEDSIELVSAEPILERVRDNSDDAVILEEVLTDTYNLELLGYGSEVVFGDCELPELSGSDFFEKLATTDINADTVSELADSIKIAYALYNMEENPSDRNLRRCIAVFGLEEDDEITTIYNNFDAVEDEDDEAETTEGDYFFDLWSSKSFTNAEDACDFYKEAVLLTKLNTAEAWSDLKEFVNEYYELLGVDEQSKSSFWKELIEESPFSSTEDFRDEYEDVLDNLDNDNKPSGGGGGGGGGSKLPTTTPVVIPTTPAPQQPQNPVVKPVFSDVGGEHWASEAIAELYEAGIISGKGEGVFAPNDLLTRAEVAKLMCSSANIDKTESVDGSFTDVAGDHWAMGYIEAALNNGLINGKGEGVYGPEDCTTREEMAVFCYRLLKTINPDFEIGEYTREDLGFADSDEVAEYAVEAVAAMTKLGIINGKGDNKFDPKAYCTRAEAAKIFYGVLQ